MTVRSGTSVHEDIRDYWSKLVRKTVEETGVHRKKLSLPLGAKLPPERSSVTRCAPASHGS